MGRGAGLRLAGADLLGELLGDLRGVASWIVGAEANQYELAALISATLLGFGYMRARSAEAGLFRAFAVGLVLSVVNQWQLGAR